MTPQHDEGTEPVDVVAKSTVGSVPLDELFDVLSSPANRYVLTYLLLEDEPVSLVDLVEYVVEETDPPQDTARAEFSGQILHRFLETTLPELEDCGLIEYDRSSRMVAETDATALTLPYLRSALQQTDPGSRERET